MLGFSVEIFEEVFRLPGKTKRGNPRSLPGPALAWISHHVREGRGFSPAVLGRSQVSFWLAAKARLSAGLKPRPSCGLMKKVRVVRNAG